MKKCLLYLIIFILPFSLFSKSIDPYKNIKYLELENGMKVYLLSNTNTINTQISLVVNAGEDIETKSNAGAIHLLEHLIFRDKNLPNSSYVSYLEKNGATHVNGYTRRYNTEYVATIESRKTDFLIKTFYKMIFEKNVSKKDLEIEKGALQTEIGELKWYDSFLYYGDSLLTFFSDIFPPQLDIYKDDFSLERRESFPHNYFYKKNNQNFTLDEIMKYYEDYYYPSNMLLKVAGNFDINKLENLIKNTFGEIKRIGTKKTIDLPRNASLNDKPYFLNTIDYTKDNYAYIGTKYLLDDYKKYLVISAYTNHLSKKMQNHLRDSLGKTYSVNSFQVNNRNAALAGVYFFSLHKDFDLNFNSIKKEIKRDVQKMSKNDIENALYDYGLYYSSVEPDSESLMELITTNEYITETHNIKDKTPFDIFQSITNEDFQNIITSTFKPESEYVFKNKSYYFFPYDMLVLVVFFLVIAVVLYVKSYLLILKDKNVMYTQRDIIFSRRLSNRLLSFFKFLTILLIAIYLDEWSEHLFFDYVLGSKYFVYTLSISEFYIYSFLSLIKFLVIFLVLNFILFRTFYSRLDVTENRLNFVGSNFFTIEKEEIKEIKEVSWSLNKFFKTLGFIIFFFRKLVMIETIDGKIFYLRASNAQHLLEDILKWKNSDLSKGEETKY